MTGNCAAGKERTRTDERESGGPVLEEDLWGSSRACEVREGREAGIREKDERIAQREKNDGSERSGDVRMSGEGRWEAAEADLEGRLLGLPADRGVGCLSPSGSVPYPGSIVQTPTDAQQTKQAVTKVQATSPSVASAQKCYVSGDNNARNRVDLSKVDTTF